MKVINYLKGIFKHKEEKPMKYHLDIIDKNVRLPLQIDKEYDNIDDAYSALSKFVHTFDGIIQVDGRVCDEDGEDVDYSSSIME